MIAEVITKKLKKHCRPRTLWRLLRRMGFSYVKPRTVLQVSLQKGAGGVHTAVQTAGQGKACRGFHGTGTRQGRCTVGSLQQIRLEVQGRLLPAAFFAVPLRDLPDCLLSLAVYQILCGLWVIAMGLDSVKLHVRDTHKLACHHHHHHHHHIVHHTVSSWTAVLSSCGGFGAGVPGKSAHVVDAPPVVS